MSRLDDFDQEIKDLEDSIESKKEQEKATQRRLDIIKVQIANVGRPYAPPERLTEEEDLENEIAQLTTQIDQLQSELTALKKKRADLGFGVREMPSSAAPIEPKLKRHKPGDYIDRYQIKELIDIDNIDTVYRAYDTHNQYEVAIKQFNTGKRYFLEDFEAKRDDFERKARLMREMEHPNIVGVRHVFPANGTSYIVMHYLPTSLDKKLSQPRYVNGMPYEQARQIFEQVCEGIYYSYKIFEKIHGHINPGNILLDNYDRPKINNFGVSFTKPDVTLLPYLAPEQQRGDRNRPETDVYALGVLFYTMLTGKNYDPTENIAKDLKRKDIPRGVIPIIRTALSKEPTDRYANVGEMLKAVNRLQMGKGLIDNIPLMIGSGLILLLLIVGVIWFSLSGSVPITPMPTPIQIVAENIPTPTETLSPTEIPTHPPAAPPLSTSTSTSTFLPTSTVLTIIPSATLSPTPLASLIATDEPNPTAGEASISQYPATAEEALTKIRQEGIITVGVRYDAPPFGRHQGWPPERCNPTRYDPDFNPQGYDILIAHELAKRWLGDENKVKFLCVPVDQRQDVVSDGKYVNIGLFSFSKANRCIDSTAMPLNSQEDKRVWCSESYMLDGQGVLTYDNSEIDILCDVKGKTVTVITGTTAAESFADAAERFCGAAPQIDARDSNVTTRDDIIDNIVAKNVLAYATNVEILNAYAFSQQGNLKLVPGKFGPSEEFSIAITPGETGLLELINQAILEWKEDGTLEQLMIDARLTCVSKPPYNLCGLKPITEQIDYKVLPGDTLSGLANDMWGKSDLWPCIVDDNLNILSPDHLRLEVGEVITITAKPADEAACVP